MEEKIAIKYRLLWWQWAIIVLTILALLICSYLTWQFYSGSQIAGCGSGSSCNSVLNSRWSTIGGIIPVSGLALSVYLGLAVTFYSLISTKDLSIKILAWKVLLILAGTIAGSALFFIGIQKWIIKEFCGYCMTLHITGLLLAILIIWRSFKESFKTQIVSQHSKENFSGKYRMSYGLITGLVSLGIAFSGILAIYQFNSNTSKTHQNKEVQKTLPKINFEKAPIIGPSNALHKITLLFDYQCSHCQNLHFMLEDVVEKYKGELAFVLAPTPLESTCNPYFPNPQGGFKYSCDFARIGLAVWLAKPDAFETFENWMYAYDNVSSSQLQKVNEAKAKAIELVSEKKFNTALADPWIAEYIQTSTTLFGKTMQNGRGGIPKMIYDDKWIIPQPYNADDLIRILKESLGVPEPL